MSRQELKQIESDLQEHLKRIKNEQTTVCEKLQYYSDDKEHDFETKNGYRISVKARKGNGNGWHRTGAIPKIEGDDCPTHLMFIHLEDDYSIDKIWLFSWTELTKTGRFKKHNVRGNHRSYYFQLNPKNDTQFICYHK